MGASSLSSRAIIGEFYNTLQQNLGATWIPLISNYFDSNQEAETYKWLGMVPAMREWIGGRQAKGLRENGLTIANKSFEATLEVLLDEIRRDKTGQVMVRVRELAARANSHWAKLLSAMIAAGESQVGYDGQYFYDTDHVEGDSGAQSNSITLDVNTPAKPTAGEMETAILQAVQQLLAIKDDQGEPLNEDASQFLVMVPINLMAPAAGALGSQIVMEGGAARSNLILTAGSLGGLDFKLVTNARLPWTTKFAVFNTGAEAKAMIRQEEEGIKVEAIAEGSEIEFKEKKHWYGVSAMRNVGYGYWQRSVLTTLT